ncbi:hypothetical protein D4A39_15920 [Alcanivorax profundi]|uniref:Preprotein translocase subunit YajC n=1 Tax=Alcanivorax profundi TaxID=2338368 RepID=A0A418XTH1_9GAMM|nr:PP0621 family protein [Alcanivorax profundi]RJG15957.1 hypothetical protein D4A39_15920 [Alcanivorax profundi]
MGLIRLLIIAALIYLAWRAAKRLLAGPQGKPPATPTQSQNMLKCQQCGVHVPANEAFSHNGKHFCCQDHQRQYLEHHES